jgi:hypothetical protein
VVASIRPGGWIAVIDVDFRDVRESVELVDIEAEYLTYQGSGGGERPRLFGLTLERLRTRMLEHGATDDDVEAAGGFARGSDGAVPRVP